METYEITNEELLKIGIDLDEKLEELSPYQFGFKVIINSEHLKEIDSGGEVMGFPDKARCYMILDSDRPDLVTIIHECMHVLDELEKYIYDKLEREARAYIVQEIFTRVMKSIGVDNTKPEE